MGEVQEFFDRYGLREWNRLDESVYARFNYALHLHFLEEYLHPGVRVLDAGCGAGRFSIEFARRGCRVTLLDVSPEQLRIAEEQAAEAGVADHIDGIYSGDIRDLSVFANEQFDVVVCYGAPLSYVLNNREQALREFHRVLVPQGHLFVSVNNKWGVLKMLLGQRFPGFFNNPEYWYIDQVIQTGDLPRHERVDHPPRHFFEAAELRGLLAHSGFTDIILGSSPCFSCGHKDSLEELAQDEKALETIMAIELKTYTKPTMVDNGEFLLAAGTKSVG